MSAPDDRRGEGPEGAHRAHADDAPATLTRPRVILDEGAKPAPRLDFGWDKAVAPVAIPAGRGWSSLALLGAGAAVLVLGFSLLEAANFVAAQFTRAAWLGWLTLVVAAGGFGSCALARCRECSLLFDEQARRPVRRDNHAAGEGEEAGEGG